MRYRFVRFWQLPRHEQWLFLQALCWLPLAHAGVRCFGFKRSCQIISRCSASGRRAAQTEQPLVAIAQSERLLNWAIAYGLHPGNCLSRSLTLWWLLRRQGLQSELRIGVRRQAGRFQAHAWIEHQGQPLNEVANVRQQYATFQDELFATLV